MLYLMAILLFLVLLNALHPSGRYPFRGLAHEERFRRRVEQGIAKAKKYRAEHYQGMTEREVLEAEARRGRRNVVLVLLFAVGLFLFAYLYATWNNQ